MLALGLAAVATLGFVPLETILPPQVQVPRAVLLIQPAIITMLCALLGWWTLPRTGLDAPVLRALLGKTDWTAPLRRGLSAAAAVAVVVALILVAYALGTAGVVLGMPQLDIPLITRLGYGGVGEEIIARWGLLTAFMALALRLGQTRNAAFWAANSLAALLFALGHFGVLFALMPHPPLWLLIAVVLGAPSTAKRNNNAEDLLLTGFDVMNRRARGEKITIAQNLFEPEPVGPIERPSVEQGDGEQDGLKIVLASAPPPRVSSYDFVDPTRNMLRGSQSADKPKADAKNPDKKAEKEGRKPAGKWVVQVGAFKSKSLAREQLALVEKRFGKHFGKADGDTDSSGGAYRARFSGFTEASAKDACGALKAKKMACMVVKPG